MKDVFVAISHIHDALNQQSGKLSDKIRELMKKHPVQCKKMLQQAGVTDALWINTVYAHHERIDGSGYPDGLIGDAIPREAKIIAIADIYLAMTTNRGYRNAKKATNALREIFANGKKDDNELYVSFIKELSVYPTGSFVSLENGEVGVVVKRCRDGVVCPVVKAILSPRGGAYPEPQLRDCKKLSYKIKGMYQSDKMPVVNINQLMETS